MCELFDSFFSFGLVPYTHDAEMIHFKWKTTEIDGEKSVYSMIKNMMKIVTKLNLMKRNAEDENPVKNTYQYVRFSMVF